MDLVIQSGILSESAQVEVLDAMAERVGEKECRERILASGPDAILFLTGIHTWEADRRLMEDVKSTTQAVVVGCGDVLWGNAVQVMEQCPSIDAVLLDFTSPSVKRMLEGESGPIENLVTRSGSEIIDGGITMSSDPFEYPIPCHDLFPLKKYRIPVAKHHPFVSLLSGYGCPFRCYFCPCGEQGFKIRKADNVIQELRFIQGMGIREIRFRDNTFGPKRDYALDLCGRMKEEAFDFTWCCLSRVDVMDEEILRAMKAAGCHTIFFGVECENDLTMEKYKDGITREKVQDVFALCRTLKIRSLAHFILGFPGEDESSIQKTVRFAIDLDPDYASFTVLEARPGTLYRKEAIDRGWISGNEISQLRRFPDPTSPSSRELDRLQKNAIRRFYFRPGYILKKLFSTDSLWELRNIVAQGFSLLKMSMRNIFP